MSNPNAPDGANQYPFSGGQQQLDPNAPYGQPQYPSGSGYAPNPYLPNPEQPASNPYSAPGQPASGMPDPYGQYGAAQPPSQYGQYGQYGQGQPSQTLPGQYAGPPSQGLGQPGQPSQYGQYAPQSQTLGGQPGQYGQFGPPSQTFPGQYGAPPSQGFAPAPVAASGPGRGLVIGSIVAVILLLVAGGVGFLGYQTSQAPALAAGKFCASLQAQDYGGVYTTLSASLQSKYTSTQFATDMLALDKAEGTVTACKASTSSGYSASPFGSSATDSVTLTRGTLGALTGSLTLVNTGSPVSGAWHVDTLPTTLLGVNLGAIQAANAFCAALVAKDYTTAYAIFASGATKVTSASELSTDAGLWDQLDGAVSTCTVTSVGAGGTDTAASLGISITRAKAGQRTATTSFSSSGATWQISQFDDTALGVDLGAYQVGQQFCADIASNKLTAAYALFDSNFQSQFSPSDFVSNWTVSNGHISKCTTDLSSYNVTGQDATENVIVALVGNNGQTASVTTKLSYLNTGGSWKIDDYLFLS